MRVKNAKKASSELQKMQTTLGRNCCSKTAPKLSAVIHCLQWITAKIALKMQWDFGHSGNLQNLQGNCLQCTYSVCIYVHNKKFALQSRLRCLVLVGLPELLC